MLAIKTDRNLHTTYCVRLLLAMELGQSMFPLSTQLQNSQRGKFVMCIFITREPQGPGARTTKHTHSEPFSLLAYRTRRISGVLQCWESAHGQPAIVVWWSKWTELLLQEPWMPDLTLQTSLLYSSCSPLEAESSHRHYLSKSQLFTFICANRIM